MLLFFNNRTYKPIITSLPFYQPGFCVTFNRNSFTVWRQCVASAHSTTTEKSWVVLKSLPAFWLFLIGRFLHLMYKYSFSLADRDGAALIDPRGVNRSFFNSSTSYHLLAWRFSTELKTTNSNYILSKFSVLCLLICLISFCKILFLFLILYFISNCYLD